MTTRPTVNKARAHLLTHQALIKYSIMPARNVHSKSESVLTPQTTAADLVAGAIDDLLFVEETEPSSREVLGFGLAIARAGPQPASGPARWRTPLGAPDASFGMIFWLIVSGMGATGLAHVLGVAPEALLRCSGLTRGPFLGAIATSVPSSASLRSSLLAASRVTSSQLSPDWLRDSAASKSFDGRMGAGEPAHIWVCVRWPIFRVPR